MTAHPDGVAFPYQANLKLEGFRNWLEYRSVRGETLSAGTFGAKVIAKWMKRQLMVKMTQYPRKVG